MQHATLATPISSALTPTQLAYFGFLARYTGATHDGYRYHLDNWLRWCLQHNLEPLTDVTRTHVELYIRHRQELGNGPSTIGSVMSPIKGAKETAIRERFDMTATRYYQVLNALIDRPEALAHDPMVVNRLRRLREQRARHRTSRRLT